MPVDDTPLSPLRCGSEWTAEFTVFADAEETDPRQFTEDDRFSFVMAPTGFHQPEEERVYTVTTDAGQIVAEDNFIDVKILGSVSEEFAPGKYVVELIRTTDPANPETIYVGEVPMSRSLPLVPLLGGGVTLPGGSSSNSRIVSGNKVKVVTGYTGGAALAEIRANNAADDAIAATLEALAATAGTIAAGNNAEAQAQVAAQIIAAGALVLEAGAVAAADRSTQAQRALIELEVRQAGQLMEFNDPSAAIQPIIVGASLGLIFGYDITTWKPKGTLVDWVVASFQPKP